MSIHPTALVDPGAQLGTDVEVGPFAVIEAKVVVGDRCRIGPHAILRGPLELGPDGDVGFSVALGHDPQVKGNRGPFGSLRIGARNVFREFFTAHRSMSPDGETVLGDDNYFMACTHVAHDCRVGNHVVMVNNAVLAGHVSVDDRAFLAGFAGVHQFSRVGRLAMVGGWAAVQRDVPPFCMVVGQRPARLEGLNLVGLRRAGISGEARLALKEAYHALFRSDEPLSARLAAVPRGVPEVDYLLDFLASSKRGVIGFGGSEGEP